MSLEYIETGNFASQNSGAKTSGMFRIVSWNINRGSCFDQVLAFLASADADLILLQECDLHARRSGFRNIAREIAQTMNMNYIFGVEFIELSQGESALHGQATLARAQLLNPRVLRFQQQSGFWKPRWFLPMHPWLQRRLGGRIALVTEITVDQRVWAVYNLHLESRHGDGLRLGQFLELLQDSRRYDSKMPVMIAGDFNCDVTQSGFSRIIHDMEFRNSFMSEARKMTTSHRKVMGSKAIDFVLHRGPVRPESATVHALTSGSDHFPLSLILRLE